MAKKAKKPAGRKAKKGTRKRKMDRKLAAGRQRCVLIGPPDRNVIARLGFVG